MTRRLVVLAIGAIAVAVLFEVGLRQIYWLPYESHPRFGSVLPAGTVARYCREGCGSSRWSGDGLRRATPFDPARPAILALGDSFTEALMTNDDDVYTHRLERALGERWQILNLGRSGLSPADYTALAPVYRETFHPRWAVIQLRWPDLQGDAWNVEKTHFARRDDGTLDAVEVLPRVSRAGRAFAPLRQRSTLLSLGAIRMREFATAAATEPPLFRGAQALPDPPAPAPAPGGSYPVETQLETVAAAWDGRFTFLFIPDFDARDPSVRDETERRFMAACDAHRWSCVNLRAAFPAFVARHASPYGFANSAFNWGHMNDDGHAAAAELLRDEITRLAALALL